jgi:hypothetical protein
MRSRRHLRPRTTGGRRRRPSIRTIRSVRSARPGRKITPEQLSYPRMVFFFSGIRSELIISRSRPSAPATSGFGPFGTHSPPTPVASGIKAPLFQAPTVRATAVQPPAVLTIEKTWTFGPASAGTAPAFGLGFIDQAKTVARNSSASSNTASGAPSAPSSLPLVNPFGNPAPSSGFLGFHQETDPVTHMPLFYQSISMAPASRNMSFEVNSS